MGILFATELPRYLDRWGVKHTLVPGWAERSRSSGGFDRVLGIGIHHDASSVSFKVSWAIAYCSENAADAPIGNGLLDRSGVFHFYCAGASNTQGRGGPVLGSRGATPVDNGNRNWFSIEAANNGVGEEWPKVQCDAYVLLCCAILDWANNETPGVPLGPADVWAHFEWTNPDDPYGPSRKIDPKGKSTWAGGFDKWNMDAFRGAVFARLLAGPPGAPPVVVPPPPPSGGEYVAVAGDGWYAIARKCAVTVSALLAVNQATIATPIGVGQVIKLPIGVVSPTPTPVPSPEEDDMPRLVAKRASDGAWFYSPNGGVSRLHVGENSQHNPQDTFLPGPAVDVKLHRLVTRWSDVGTIADVDIDRLLGPLAR